MVANQTTTVSSALPQRQLLTVSHTTSNDSINHFMKCSDWTRDNECSEVWVKKVLDWQRWAECWLALSRDVAHQQPRAGNVLPQRSDAYKFALSTRLTDHLKSLFGFASCIPVLSHWSHYVTMLLHERAHFQKSLSNTTSTLKRSSQQADAREH